MQQDLNLGVFMDSIIEMEIYHLPSVEFMRAIIRYDGSQEWFKNGKTHRDKDLPAVIYANGAYSWYTDGAFIKTNFLDIL